MNQKTIVRAVAAVAGGVVVTVVALAIINRVPFLRQIANQA